MKKNSPKLALLVISIVAATLAVVSQAPIHVLIAVLVTSVKAPYLLDQTLKPRRNAMR